MWYKNLKFFFFEKLTFQIVGIDLLATEESKILRQPLKLFLPLIGMFSMCLSMIGYSIQNSNDVNKIAESYTIVLEAFAIMAKILLFVVKRKRFVRLIRDMQDLAEKSNPKERQHWLEENRYTTLIASFYTIVIWATSVLYNVKPLLLFVNDYLNNADNLSLNLQFQGLFPYDHTQPLPFALTYLGTIFTIVFGINFMGSVDCLYCWYIHNISAHFRILNVKLIKLARQLKRRDNDLDHCLKLLKAAVDYHRRVIYFVKEMNAVFGEIIFVEVTFSCVQMCFTIFLLSSDDVEPIIMALTVMVFISISIQLVIYCFCGEKIQSNSEMICLNLYQLFPWESMTPDMRRLLLLPLMRSQRVSIIRGFFFVVNRNLLLMVFKSAASFSALLTAMDVQ